LTQCDFLMTIFLRHCLLVLALCLALPAGPVRAQDTPSGPSGSIATENNRAIDAGIAVRIREILGEIGGYEDVTVTVAEGVVTLRGTTTTANDATALLNLVTRVEGVVAIKNEVAETTDLRRRLNPAVARFMTRIQQTLTLLPLAAIAMVAFLTVNTIGYLIARLRWPWDRLAPNAFIADLYRQLIQIASAIGGVVMALDILDASAFLSTILGAAGIVGLAIGFAVRDTVENYIASIVLSVRQPFRPNDTVDIAGEEGKVIRLNSRATILLSYDGNHIRIPNATVFKARIINYTENAERRLKFSVRIDAGNDLHMARLLAVETMQNLPFMLDVPVAQAWIETIDAGAVEIVVTGWIDQHKTSILLARGEAMRQVKIAFDGAGIGAPDATYAVQITQGPPDLSQDRAPAPTPRPARPAESAEVEEVAAVNEGVLEKMIAAERGRDEIEDLLRPDARKE